jgi:hypothetical protein
MQLEDVSTGGRFTRTQMMIGPAAYHCFGV